MRQLSVKPTGTVTLLYALPLDEVDHTLGRVEVFLLLGVLGGTILALLAGLFVSARAMRPDRRADRCGAGDRAHA